MTGDHTFRSAIRRVPMGLFVISVAMAALSIALGGMAIDAGLRSVGVGIHYWAEGVISGLLGFVFAAPGIIVAWRIGLVTLLHYMLASMILFLPATLMAEVIYAPLGLFITPPDSMLDSHGGAPTLYSNFIRLMRATVLTPIFLLTFWLFYHRIFNLRPVS